jgi:hypothetical protein
VHEPGASEHTGSRGLRPWMLALTSLGVLGVIAVTAVVLAGMLADAAPTVADEPDGTAHAGASSDGYAVWERNADGTPVRWDACTPIEIVLEPTGAPDGATDDLAAAVERLRAATGLDLVVQGVTDERPTGQRPPYQPERYGERWAPVLVAWAPPGEAGIPLRATDRGLAIPIALGRPGDRTYVTGQVVLNADRHDLPPGF